MDGVFTATFGRLEVTALCDGVVDYEPSILSGATPEQLVAALGEEGSRTAAGMAYTAFLARIGDRRILIDTGTGGKNPDSPGFQGTGLALGRLEASGHRPEQIDDVCITHVGLDHVGGLTTGSGRTFPNAVVRISRPEREFLDALIADPASADHFRHQAAALASYEEAGRLAVFEGDQELGDHLASVSMHGHTPGHTGFRVASGTDSVLFVGDLVHWAAVQFPYPDAHGVFDSDQERGSAERRRILGDAADEGIPIAGSHLPFPGIGRVARSGDGFAWIPHPSSR